MNQAHGKSFFIVLSLIFLLPIFFVPGGFLDLGVSKATILLVAIILSMLVFLLEVKRVSRVGIPWNPLILIAIFLPLVYLLSSLRTIPSALSLFGYNFEVGTFGYILLGSTLLILISILFSDTSKLLRALTAYFISFSLVTFFVVVKIVSGFYIQSGSVPVWGVFFGNMGNPIGRWTDLAIAFGLLSLVSLMILGILPMKRLSRYFVYLIFGLSTILLSILNFSLAFIITLGGALVLLVYFSSVEKKLSPESNKGRVLLPICLVIISALFLINPTISATRGPLGDVLTNTFGITNTEVRPSFSATLGVSKSVLLEDILLGSGPNTFSRNWLIYKPAEVNTSPFWGVSFPFGIGFIPTQVASTGAIGTVVWLVFFVLLLWLGIKSLYKIPAESKSLRFALVSSLIASLYLWTASFLYAPSFVVLTLAFIFTGLFVAASYQSGIISYRIVILDKNRITKLASTLLMLLLVLGLIYLGFIALNKTISAFYFKRAVDLSNAENTTLEMIEEKLNGAIKFAPADIHYTALSRINFAKAQRAVSDTDGSSEEDAAVFQLAISESISSAQQALNINPASYSNWLVLGSIYSALVPPPLSVSGSYEYALDAYSEAKKRNPIGPEIPLSLAWLELGRGEIDLARAHIEESLTLKPDYVDAYLLLVQIEISEDNTEEAVRYVENLIILVPDNASFHFGLGFLKYSNADYTGAAQAMFNAISLVPDYADAQYYYGLSLARLGRLSEALEQFELLYTTNPENEDVQIILNELRAGRSPI